MAAVEQLVTDHLDLWTTCIKRRSTAGRGSSSKVELYGINKLRELILELAVRGLLVPQDLNDEPASELLKRLAAEKARLVKEDKIKKDKPLPPVSENEKLFTAPSGWEWSRIADIGYDFGQKTPDDDFTYIDVGAIDSQLGFIDSPMILSADDAPSRARKLVNRGTVIYSTVRPYLLNIAIIQEDFDPMPIVSTAFAVVHPLEGVVGSYIYRYLRSPSFVSYVKRVQTGIAYPAINDRQFFKGLIPLPPTAEQHRIVAKVDELMALCDRLEQQTDASIRAHQTLVGVLLDSLTNAVDYAQFANSWQRVAAHFDILFNTEDSIDNLKRTILQLAVKGRLVPQDPNEESATELLEKIAVEKARLVQKGKIKKDKSPPSITKTESPIDLPKGWVWVGLQTIAVVGTGATPARDNNSYFNPQEYSWVTSGETSQPFVFETKEKISSRAVAETNVSIYPVGTLVVAMYGQGKTRGQITELMIPAGTNQACAAIQLIESTPAHRSYIKMFFQKAYEEIRSLAEGGAQPNLNVGKISETILPLPPLGEQRRIVSKVDALMELCDQLKNNLRGAQAIQLHLANTLTEKALERA